MPSYLPMLLGPLNILLIRVIGWIPISLLFVSQVQRVNFAPQFSAHCHHQSLQGPSLIYIILHCLNYLSSSFSIPTLILLLDTSCNMFDIDPWSFKTCGVLCTPFTFTKMVLGCKSLFPTVFTQHCVLELYPHCCDFPSDGHLGYCQLPDVTLWWKSLWMSLQTFARISFVLLKNFVHTSCFLTILLGI